MLGFLIGLAFLFNVGVLQPLIDYFLSLVPTGASFIDQIPAGAL